MKLFSEKVTPTFTNSSFNILQVENFSEIFFDVYEIELNKIKYPVEKVSEYEGNPVVSVPVVMGEKEQNYPFVLIKGSQGVFFNEKNTFEDIDIEIVRENISHPISECIEEFEESIFPETSFDEDNLLELEESVKCDIQKQLEKAKQTAFEYAEKIKIQKLNEANADLAERSKILKSTLEDAKSDLINEFFDITKKIRTEIISANNDRYYEISETIDNKIVDLANSLKESVNNDFEKTSKKFESNIKIFVKDLYEQITIPEIKNGLSDIATDVISKVSLIEKNLNSKLNEKANSENLEDVNAQVDALRESTVELNNSIKKNINKALSRVGNVNNRIDEVASDIIAQVDAKIKLASKEIAKLYTEKLKIIDEQSIELNEKSRNYVSDLLHESKRNLISEIRTIQKKAPIEYIIEAKGKKQKKSLDSFESELDKKISNKINDEIIRLKKYISVYSSGGGSVAAQFADGGTINGDINVNGEILSGGINLIEIFNNNVASGQYLALSGGTISGSLSVTGSVDLNANTTWYNVPYSYTDSNNIFVTGITETLLISSINSDIKDSLDKVNVFYNPSTTYYNTGSSFSVQGTLEEVIANNAYDVSVLQQSVSSEQTQLDDLQDRVSALYTYLIQNFEESIVASSNSISEFITSEWSPSLGLTPGSTVTLSSINTVYILGNSDGSGVNDYYEVNLKPNFLFYKTNLNDNAILDSFPLSAMKSSKYVIQVEDRTTGDIYYGEINVVTNNSVAVASEYSSNYTTSVPFVEFGAVLLNQRVCLSAIPLEGYTMNNFIFKGNRTNFF
jgi:hypothetical protein